MHRLTWPISLTFSLFFFLSFQRCKAGFIEASAKNNVNVDASFHQLVRMINAWRDLHPLNSASGAKKKGCEIL